jgi:FAD-linked sulfhydryl oxidase
MIRSNRFALLALLVFAALSFLFLGPYKARLPNVPSITHDGQQTRSSGDSQALLTGHAIAPKLGNETAKYVQNNVHGHECAGANKT